MKKIATFLFLALASLGIAAERTAEEWIEELSATFAKLDGFIATYVSVGEGKRLEATVALDVASQKALIQMQVEKEGAKTEMKQWSTGPDEVYISAHGGLLKAEGLKAMMEKQVALLMKPFADVAPGEELVSNAALSAAFHLTRDQVSMGLGFAPADKPAWASEVERAEVEAVDEQTVTFRTEDLGLFVISRVNGLLVRQSLRGPDGEPRDLELQHAVINPGEKEVAAISSEWPVEGAKAFGPPDRMFVGLRLTFFQQLIREIERTDADVADLKRQLDDNREPLLMLAASCISDERRLLRDEELALLNKQAAEQVRQAVEANDVGVEAEAILRSRQFRSTANEKFVANVRGNPGTRARVLVEIFGSPTGVAARKPAGEAAKELIEESLVSGYVGLLLYRSMDQAWGPVAD